MLDKHNPEKWLSDLATASDVSYRDFAENYSSTLYRQSHEKIEEMCKKVALMGDGWALAVETDWRKNDQNHIYEYLLSFTILRPGSLAQSTPGKTLFIYGPWPREMVEEYFSDRTDLPTSV